MSEVIIQLPGEHSARGDRASVGLDGMRAENSPNGERNSPIAGDSSGHERAMREVKEPICILPGWLGMIFELLLPVLAMGSARLGPIQLVFSLSSYLIHSENRVLTRVTLQRLLAIVYFGKRLAFLSLLLLGLRAGRIGHLIANYRLTSLQRAIYNEG